MSDNRKSLHRSGLPLVALLLLIPPPLFWAGNFIVARAVRNDIPPITLLFWRWVIACALLLPFAWPVMKRDLPRYWQHRRHIFAASLAGIVMFNACVYMGLQSTTASNALLLNSLVPILIVLFGVAFYRQQLAHAQVLGMAISLLGVLTIILQGEWSRLTHLQFSVGDLIVFCAMVSWAFYTLWLRQIPADLNRIGLMAVQMLVGLTVLLPLYLLETHWGRSPVWNYRSISGLAYVGIFPSVVAYLLYNLGVAKVGAARAGISIHLIPVFGVLLAVIFLKESLHYYHVVGIAGIAMGVFLCTRMTNNTERAERPECASPKL